MAVLLELVNGGGPDGEHETDLVDEVGNVVDAIGGGVRDGAEEVAEEVTGGVDGPANGDDGAHGVEGALHRLGGVSARLDLGGLAEENFEEDESPAEHAADETGPGGDEVGLTAISEGEHDNGTEEETPEDTTRDRANRAEDEEELNHLKRDGDGPIDVTVDDGGHEVRNPILAHVEIMDGGDEGDQSSDGEGGTPVTLDTAGFHEEEHGGGNHGNGDDPERNGDGVMASDPVGFGVADKVGQSIGGDAPELASGLGELIEGAEIEVLETVHDDLESQQN